MASKWVIKSYFTAGSTSPEEAVLGLFVRYCSSQQDDKHSGVEASAGFAPDFRLKPRLHLCNIILTATLFVRYVFLPVALLLWAVVISGCGSLPSAAVPPTPTPAPLHVTVTGLVDNPLTLTADNLGDFRGYGRESTMVCPDGTYETEEATWQGVLLSDLFEAAGIRPEARKFTVYSDFDGYQQTFKLSELAEKDIFLAVTKDNRPMTFDEGAPARIVAHEEWGFRWVRWVSRIEITE